MGIILTKIFQTSGRYVFITFLATFSQHIRWVRIFPGRLKCFFWGGKWGVLPIPEQVDSPVLCLLETCLNGEPCFQRSSSNAGTLARAS